MAEFALPEIAQPRHAKGIIIDRHEIAHEHLLSVTMWLGIGRRPKRRWFTSRGVAIAYAADRADDLGLLLVDLTERTDGAE